MRWTEKEVEFLRKNYETNLDMKEIVMVLKKSVRAIQHKGSRIGLSRPRFKKVGSEAKPKNEVDKKYYEKNKKKIKKRRKNRVDKFRMELKKKLGGKCKKCGYKRSLYALDFHHVGEKEFVVSRLIRDRSKKKALKEVRKCILLCANCHRELHHEGL